MSVPPGRRVLVALRTASGYQRLARVTENRSVARHHVQDETSLVPSAHVRCVRALAESALPQLLAEYVELGRRCHLGDEIHIDGLARWRPATIGYQKANRTPTYEHKFLAQFAKRSSHEFYSSDVRVVGVHPSSSSNRTKASSRSLAAPTLRASSNVMTSKSRSSCAHAAGTEGCRGLRLGPNADPAGSGQTGATESGSSKCCRRVGPAIAVGMPRECVPNTPGNAYFRP